MSKSSPEEIKKKLAPVLIVDEDDRKRHALEKLLLQEGYTVLSSPTKEDALNYLQHQNISIIISYHKEGGTSALDLLSQIKTIKPTIERILIGSFSLGDPLLEEVKPVHVMDHFFENNALVELVQNCFDRYTIRFEHGEMSAFLKEQKQKHQDAEEQLNQDRILGRKIHQSLLIDTPPKDLPGISLNLYAYASHLLDGDFVSFFRPTQNLLDFVMGDVMGKGLPSALVSTALKGEISRYAEPYLERSIVFNHKKFWHEDLPTIKEVLTEVHRSYVEKLFNLEYFVSLFYGRIDIRKRTLNFIDCGFTNPLYFRHASKKAIFIRSSHFPLGTVKHSEYSSYEIHYEENDFFLFYSDGIIAASSPSGELFGEKRLADLVETHFDLSNEDLSKTINQAVLDFTGKEAIEDDCTLLILKVDELSSIQSLVPGIAKFNSVLSQLEAVRKVTQEACLKAPGNVDRLSRELQLAVDEIFTNIVMHGYGEKPGSPITISIDYLKEELMIEISDQGIPFDPYKVPWINLFGDQDHGYGWHLIRQIADRVVYTPKKTEHGWNHLRLYKRYYMKREEIMELSEFEKNGVLVICLEDESLDAKQVPEFKEKALKIIEEKGIDQVIFDLKKLQFIDSSGLGAFLSLMRQLHTRGGHMSLAAMNKSVKTIFELVSMQKIFDCHDTLEHACESKKK